MAGPASSESGWAQRPATSPSGPSPRCGLRIGSSPPRPGRTRRRARRWSGPPLEVGRPGGPRDRGRRRGPTTLGVQPPTSCWAISTEELVAFVVLGDPNVYSIFPPLRRSNGATGLDVETVPGSWPSRSWPPGRAPSCRWQRSGDHLTFLGFGGPVDWRSLDDGGGVIVYRAGGLPELAAELDRRGRLEGRGGRDARPGRAVGPYRRRCATDPPAISRWWWCHRRRDPDDAGGQGDLVRGIGTRCPDLTLRAVDRLSRADVIVWADPSSPHVLEHGPEAVLSTHRSRCWSRSPTCSRHGAPIVRLQSGTPRCLAQSQSRSNGASQRRDFEIVPGVSSRCGRSASGTDRPGPGPDRGPDAVGVEDAASMPDR